jgi:hypothetical protein
LAPRRARRPSRSGSGVDCQALSSTRPASAPIRSVLVPHLSRSGPPHVRTWPSRTRAQTVDRVSHLRRREDIVRESFRLSRPDAAPHSVLGPSARAYSSYSFAGGLAIFCSRLNRRTTKKAGRGGVPSSGRCGGRSHRAKGTPTAPYSRSQRSRSERCTRRSSRPRPRCQARTGAGTHHYGGRARSGTCRRRGRCRVVTG